MPLQYQIPASKVTTEKMADGKTSYKQYLLDLCQKRNDELGRIVRDRILGSPADLHAADAKYHRKCNAYFHYFLKDNTDDGSSTADEQVFSETLKLLVMIAQRFGIHWTLKLYTATKVGTSCPGVF